MEVEKVCDYNVFNSFVSIYVKDRHINVLGIVGNDQVAYNNRGPKQPQRNESQVNHCGYDPILYYSIDIESIR